MPEKRKQEVVLTEKNTDTIMNGKLKNNFELNERHSGGAGM